MTIVAPPLPTELQVEVTGSCNLACEMCLVRYRPKLGRREGAMSFATFKSIVDELPALEKITLQGLGEPLLAPDLFEMIEYAAARGVRMGFNTNGTFLSRERVERLVNAGLDWLHVSVDGATAETYESIRHGSSFERVRKNVIGLVETMRELHATRPVVQLVFVAMRRNVAEIPALVRLAHEWGVGRLWVQNLSHSFDDTMDSAGYGEIRLYAEREALWGGDDRAVAEDAFARGQSTADELGVELRLPRLEEPPAVARDPGAPGCHWPFESAYVKYDAKVQPCCMVMGSDRAILGDAEAKTFADVWHSPEYASFRQGLTGSGEPPEVCRGCALYRRVF
jgi:radical SAM protein with 4Fe4S-binding SPASM domain